jgi:hypothetical protein
MRGRGEGLDLETTWIARWRRWIRRGMRRCRMPPKSRAVGTSVGIKWIAKGIASRGRVI